MRTLCHIVRLELVQRLEEGVLPYEDERSRHSLLTVCTKRSAKALRFGECGGSPGSISMEFPFGRPVHSDVIPGGTIRLLSDGTVPEKYCFAHGLAPNEVRRFRADMPSDIFCCFQV